MAGPITAIRTAARAMMRIGRRQNETAQNINRAFIEPEGAADVSLERQQVRQIIDVNLYDSAASVIKTSDEMTEAALDITG